MKTKKVITAKIDRLSFPCTGLAKTVEGEVKIKDAFPGQTVSASMRRRGAKKEARLLEVLERADYETAPQCPHFGICGSCRFLGMPYEKQLELKERAALSLFEENGINLGEYRGITPSPEVFGYRNKMEFSFGDTGLNGELSLGMRRKNSYYEVVHVSQCKLVDGATRAALNETLRFFRGEGVTHYNTRRAEGVLRHLVTRTSKCGELLVNLVTTREIAETAVLGFRDAMLGLNISIAGILHTVNDSPADTVKLDDVRLLHGKDHIYGQVLGLRFKISPQSFFQTNTLGAEVLYKTVLEFAGQSALAYDLYCGTGTIALLLSARAKKVYGIELVPEAVAAAAEAAKINAVKNAEFICGDVFAEADRLAALSGKPDLIVIDPPRNGAGPKALKKIISFEAERVIYVSCNPKTLARDLPVFFENGYAIPKAALVDMFPWCAHVECVVELCRK